MEQGGRGIFWGLYVGAFRVMFGRRSGRRSEESFGEAFSGAAVGGSFGVVFGRGAGPWLPAPLRHEMIFCWNQLFFKVIVSFLFVSSCLLC